MFPYLKGVRIADVLLVDGGVHFLAYDIGAKAFAGLGTRDSDDIGRLYRLRD